MTDPSITVADLWAHLNNDTAGFLPMAMFHPRDPRHTVAAAFQVISILNARRRAHGLPPFRSPTFLMCCLNIIALEPPDSQLA